MTTPVDDRVEPPEQPKTVKDIAAVPQWAIELTQAMKSGIAEVRADVSLVSNDLGIVKDRVAILETERAKLSGGVRGLSQSEAGQNMQIASLAVKVDQLDGKTDAQTLILKELIGLTEKPVVKLALTAIGSAVLSYLAAKGFR